jgi:hypothetical protein
VSTDDRELARILLIEVIPDMVRRGSEYDGAVRLAARRLVERSRDDAEEPPYGRCVECAEPLPKPTGRGRPRKTCPTCLTEKSRIMSLGA